MDAEKKELYAIIDEQSKLIDKINNDSIAFVKKVTEDQAHVRLILMLLYEEMNITDMQPNINMFGFSVYIILKYATEIKTVSDWIKIREESIKMTKEDTT